MVKAFCGHCGAEIGRGRYCNSACRQAAYRARHGAGTVTPSERAKRAAVTRGARVVELTCGHCGGAFTANGNQAAQGVIYCSDACKQAAYRARARRTDYETIAPFFVPYAAVKAAPKTAYRAGRYCLDYWTLHHDEYREVSITELAELVRRLGGQWYIQNPDED